MGKPSVDGRSPAEAGGGGGGVPCLAENQGGLPCLAAARPCRRAATAALPCPVRPAAHTRRTGRSPLPPKNQIYEMMPTSRDMLASMRSMALGSAPELVTSSEQTWMQNMGGLGEASCGGRGGAGGGRACELSAGAACEARQAGGTKIPAWRSEGPQGQGLAARVAPCPGEPHAPAGISALDPGGTPGTPTGATAYTHGALPNANTGTPAARRFRAAGAKLCSGQLSGPAAAAAAAEAAGAAMAAAAEAAAGGGPPATPPPQGAAARAARAAARPPRAGAPRRRGPAPPPSASWPPCWPRPGSSSALAGPGPCGQK
jgi:hypothetical protein